MYVSGFTLSGSDSAGACSLLVLDAITEEVLYESSVGVTEANLEYLEPMSLLRALMYVDSYHKLPKSVIIRTDSSALCDYINSGQLHKWIEKEGSQFVRANSLGWADIDELLTHNLKGIVDIEYRSDSDPYIARSRDNVVTKIREYSI